MQNVGVDAITRIDASEVDKLVFLDENLLKVRVDSENLTMPYYNSCATSWHYNNARHLTLVDGMHILAGQNVHVDTVVTNLDLRDERVVMLSELTRYDEAADRPRQTTLILKNLLGKRLCGIIFGRFGFTSRISRFSFFLCFCGLSASPFGLLLNDG